MLAAELVAELEETSGPRVERFFSSARAQTRSPEAPGLVLVRITPGELAILERLAAPRGSSPAVVLSELLQAAEALLGRAE